jgi:ubiquitin C-terminal hydrolase
MVGLWSTIVLLTGKYLMVNLVLICLISAKDLITLLREIKYDSFIKNVSKWYCKRDSYVSVN